MPLGVSSSPTPTKAAPRSGNTGIMGPRSSSGTGTGNSGPVGVLSPSGSPLTSPGVFSKPATSPVTTSRPPATGSPGATGQPILNPAPGTNAANLSAMNGGLGALNSSVTAQLAAINTGNRNTQSANNDLLGLNQNNFGLQSGYLRNDANVAYGQNSNASTNNQADALLTNQNYARGTTDYGGDVANTYRLDGFNTTGRDNAVLSATNLYNNQYKTAGDNYNNAYAATGHQYDNTYKAAGDNYDNSYKQSTDDFNSNIGQANYTAGVNGRAVRSDNTGRGALLSQGFGQANSDIASQLGLTTTAATNNRDNQYKSELDTRTNTWQSALNTRDDTRQQALSNRDNTWDAATNTRDSTFRNSNLNFAQNANTNSESRRNLDSAQQGRTDQYAHDTTFLNTQASNLGLDRSQITNNLNRGLQNLGYDNATQARILKAANDTSNTNAAAQAQSVLSQALGIGAQIGQAYNTSQPTTNGVAPTVRVSSSVTPGQANKPVSPINPGGAWTNTGITGSYNGAKPATSVATASGGLFKPTVTASYTPSSATKAKVAAKPTTKSPNAGGH